MERHLPVCAICGGSEYVKESGFFYCKECQTQSQDIHDQVVGIEAGSVASVERDANKSVKSRKKKGQGNQSANEIELTSWEIYNSILIGQVQELLELGAPPEIRLTVFKLWVYYLKKLEVAFFSKSCQALPRLGPGYSEKDALLIYGMKQLKRRKVGSSRASSSAMSTAGMSSWDESLQKKRALKKSKRDLMTQESLLQSETNDTTDFNESSLLDQSSRLSESCYEPSEVSIGSCHKVRYSTIARAAHKRNPGKDVQQIHFHYFKPTNISKFKLVVLLYLALLYHGCAIQISDIFRWIRESHLSYYDVSPFLPLNYKFSQKEYNAFGPVQFLPSYSSFMAIADSLAKFLDLTDWHTPNVKYLANKYVSDFNLPALFATLIERFICMMPLTYLWHANEIPKYEIRILAILAIIMKLLLGLDGKTELEISSVASELNNLAKKKKHRGAFVELFVWSDWVKYIICRNGVLARHHFPTKDLLYPAVYNPGLFVQYAKKWNRTHTEAKDSFKSFYVNGAPSRILDIVEETLDKLRCLPEEEEVEFPATLMPFSTYTHCVLKAHAQSPNVYVAEAEEIISKDFSGSDAHYLLEPERCVELAKEHNWHLRVKYRSAQKNFKIVPKRKAVQRVVNCRKKVIYLVKCAKRVKPSQWKERGIARQKFKNSEAGGYVRQRETLSRSKEGGVRPKYIYSPSMHYWVWEGALNDINDNDFNSEVASTLPLSFVWVLDEFAQVAETSKKMIFQEIMLIERVYKRHYKKFISSVRL